MSQKCLYTGPRIQNFKKLKPSTSFTLTHSLSKTARICPMPSKSNSTSSTNIKKVQIRPKNTITKKSKPNNPTTTAFLTPVDDISSPLTTDDLMLEEEAEQFADKLFNDEGKRCFAGNKQYCKHCVDMCNAYVDYRLLIDPKTFNGLEEDGKDDVHHDRSSDYHFHIMTCSNYNESDEEDFKEHLTYTVNHISDFITCFCFKNEDNPKLCLKLIITIFKAMVEDNNKIKDKPNIKTIFGPNTHGMCEHVLTHIYKSAQYDDSTAEEFLNSFLKKDKISCSEMCNYLSSK